MTDKPNPPIVTEPLTVDVLDDQILLDGDQRVDVALTPEAAIETGIRLINAGVGIDPKPRS